MNFNVKNIPHYFIIVLSVIYNAYTASHFLSKMTSYSIAVLASVILSILAHYYLVLMIDELRKKRLSGAIPVSLLLCGVCIFADLQGVSKSQNDTVVNPVSEEYQSKLLAVEKQISEVTLMMKNNANHSSGSRTNWAKYNTYNSAVKRLSELEKKHESVKLEKAKNIQLATVEATNQSQQFQVLSIVLFLLSICVSTLIKHEPKQQYEPTLNNISPTLQTADVKNTVFVAENKQNNVEAEGQKIGFQMSNNKEKELIEMWVKGIRDTSTLSRTLGVNFKALKELKISAGLK